MSDILTPEQPTTAKVEVQEFPPADTKSVETIINENVDEPAKFEPAVDDIKKITILYGSQTGTAQDVAERIWRQAKKLDFFASVLPMDEYPVVNFAYEKLVVFVCSTTGQGDEPDNMKCFWKILLRKNLPQDALAHIEYAVIGLGDSSYLKFNFVAKRLFKRVQQLGGYPILPIALADDQHDLGVDFVVDQFLKVFWDKMLATNPLPSDFKLLDDDLIYRWKVQEVTHRTQPIKLKSIYDVYDSEKSFKVSIKSNERITSSQHFQDVRLIKFRISEDQSFNPGDVLMIRPKNLEAQVTEFFSLLYAHRVKLNRKTRVKLVSIHDQMPVPPVLQKVWTLEHICRDYWDLSAIPRRYVFQVLAQITTSDLEREKCLEFTKPEGQEELYNYCNRPRRTILEVLGDFPHAAENLTLEVLFEIMSPIRQRAFSIASSNAAYSSEIHILVAVVKYKTKLVKERLGLCSNWLASLIVGDEFRVSIRRGTFKFPVNRDFELQGGNLPPIIMVGPGTGVAPFRAYIMDRVASGDATKDKLFLFFGCRYQKSDFLCKEEFDKLTAQGRLTLFCAFSRDQEEKVYVQHKILENRELVADLLLHKNAYIFIAGNAKNMPNDVRNAFLEVVLKARTAYTRADAEEFMENLEKSGRYQTETWS